MSIPCSICKSTTWKCSSTIYVRILAIFNTETQKMEYRQGRTDADDVGYWKCANGHIATDDEHDLIAESEPLLEIEFR